MITKAQFDQDLKVLLAEDKNPFNAWVRTTTGVAPCHPLDASVLILGINNTEGLPDGKSFEKDYWDPVTGYDQPARDRDLKKPTLKKLTPSKGRMRALIPVGVGVVKTNVYEKNTKQANELKKADKTVRKETIIWILERCSGITRVVTLGNGPAEEYEKLRKCYPKFPSAINVPHPTAWGIRNEAWNDSRGIRRKGWKDFAADIADAL